MGLKRGPSLLVESRALTDTWLNPNVSGGLIETWTGGLRDSWGPGGGLILSLVLLSVYPILRLHILSV